MDSVGLAQLTFWDYLVFVIGGISIAIGALKGMIKTVFGLAAWACAVLVPAVLIPALLPGGFAAMNWPLPVWVTNIICFFVVLVLVQLLGNFLSGLVGKVGLGGTDRFFGGVIGAARALLILAIAVVIGGAFGAPRTTAWQQSLSRPLLDYLFALVQPMVGPLKTTGA